ncbi:MAG: hypothetical protein HEQ23_16825 [Tepidisphaera sp.]
MRELFAEEELGQLFDLAVPDATAEAWAGFLSGVVPLYAYRFAWLTEEGERAEPLPADGLGVIVKGGSDDGPWPSLRLDVLGLEMVVHFYGPDFIELSGPSRDVNAERYAGLAELMVRMGESMGCDVFLTHESYEDASEMVYEVAEGRFRKPRHGEGPGGAVREEVLRGFYVAAAKLAGKDLATETPLIAIAAREVEMIRRGHTTLTLQDELRMDERGEIASFLSLAQGILRPPPGLDPEVCRRGYVRDLSRLVNVAAARKLGFTGDEESRRGGLR